MPCKNLSLLFSPFNTNSTVTVGITANNGAISMEQDQGGPGSSFTIELDPTVSPTELSWMSPIQLESEKLSIFTENGTRGREPDLLYSNPFFIFVTVMSCLGNVAIICLITSVAKFRKPANLLIANLAISCLLFMVSVNLRYMEFSMDLWDYSTTWCNLLAVLHRFPVPLVAVTTMAISFDRGRVARNPLTRSCTMNPFGKVILIWIFSLLIAIPLGFSRKFDPCVTNPYKCTKTLLLNSNGVSVSYAVLFLSSVYLIPAIILVQESAKTLRKIRFLRASIVTWTENRVGVQLFPTFPDTRLKLLRNSVAFSLIFLVFWLPFGFAQFILDCPKNMVPDFLMAYAQFYVAVLKNFTYIQVVLNPVILFMLSYDFGTYCHRFRMKCPHFV